MWRAPPHLGIHKPQWCANCQLLSRFCVKSSRTLHTVSEVRGYFSSVDIHTAWTEDNDSIESICDSVSGTDAKLHMAKP